MPSKNRTERLNRAYLSLEGLSVGDAFGETFFVNPAMVDELIQERAMTTVTPWYFTDDTNMALSVVSVLRQYGQIEQNALAKSFADRYVAARGYGAAMHRMLRQIRDGQDWREISRGLFEGQGSYGNGAAMRVAPLGAYFADDMDKLIEQATLSAEITHTNPEGIAGAIAVAVATALVWQWREAGKKPGYTEFFDEILKYTPQSVVRERIRHARNLGEGASVQLAVAALGNGSLVSAQDTVPFSLWCVAQHLDNYEEAFWLTVSGLGDRDTTCAIVGGIIAVYTGLDGIPAVWRNNREALPDWFREEK